MSRKKPKPHVPLSLREAEAGKGRAKASSTDEAPLTSKRCICVNPHCRLRRAGCRGFVGCPGFKGA
jgi:hypothetical protein